MTRMDYYLRRSATYLLVVLIEGAKVARSSIQGTSCISKCEEDWDFSGGVAQRNVVTADVDLQSDSLDSEFTKLNLTLETFNKSLYCDACMSFISLPSKLHLYMLTH